MRILLEGPQMLTGLCETSEKRARALSGYTRKKSPPRHVNYRSDANLILNDLKYSPGFE